MLPNQRIGEILIAKGVLTQIQLDKALSIKLSTKKHLGEILIELGYLSEHQVLEHLFVQLAQKINLILGPMAQAELLLAELYGICAKLFPEENNFWLDLSHDEMKHAETIEEMISIIRKKPHLFQEGYPFKAEAVQTFLSGIRQTIELVRNGSLDKIQIISLARNYEHSILEAKYLDAITSTDKEFIALQKKIRQQDFIHRQKLDKKLQG